MSKLELGLPIGKDVMEGLHRSLGEEIDIKRVFNSRTYVAQGRLVEVTDFVRIGVGDGNSQLWIPFIYGDGAIQAIKRRTDKIVVYENPLIKDGHSVRDENFLNLLRVKSFGRNARLEWVQGRLN